MGRPRFLDSAVVVEHPLGVLDSQWCQPGDLGGQAWASAKVPMRFAIPVCSAISAVSFSALSSIARARPCPTNDDSRRMLQLSRARPYFDVGNWKKASGATTRRSHCMASCKPAPMAGPLIAPTTGIGEASIALCSSMSRSG